jgi:hypothetical protein
MCGVERAAGKKKSQNLASVAVNDEQVVINIKACAFSESDAIGVLDKGRSGATGR